MQEAVNSPGAGPAVRSVRTICRRGAGPQPALLVILQRVGAGLTAKFHLRRALISEKNDDPVAWRFLSQAYDAKNMPGEARLAAAEEHFDLGQLGDAKAFAMRARESLKRNTPDWRRATDIVLVAATPEDVKELSRADHGEN